MKFRIERDAIADAVVWAARSLPNRPPLPILSGLVVAADADAVTLSSFDYEVSARAVVPGSCDEPGRTVVSGRLLADIVKALPAASVDISSDGTRVEIRCGRATFTLPTLPVDEYPVLPELPPTTGRVQGAAFASAVAQVSVAAGRDDTLPTLTGVRMEFTKSRVTMAATDRYRLAVRDIEWQSDTTNEDTAILVPSRVLSEVAKSFTTADEVAIALGADKAGIVGFEGGSRRTTSRLLDGEFPKYRTLLPNESATAARVVAADLIESVRRVSLVAERNVPIRLTFGDGQIGLEAGAGEDAKATESIEAEIEGEAVEIAFNPGYLLEGLAAIDTPTVQLSFTTATRPAVITPYGEGAEPYTYLLMPVRLAG